MLQGPRQRRGLQKPPGLPRLDTLAAPRGVYLYSVLDAMGTDLVTGRWGQRAYPIGSTLVPTAFGQGTTGSAYPNLAWSYAVYKDLPQTISSVFRCGTTDSQLVGCGLAGGLSVVSGKLQANWWNGSTIVLAGVTTLQTGFFYVATLVMTLHSMTLYLNGAFESTYSSVPVFANYNITPIGIGSNTGSAQSLSICLANAAWSADEILSHARSPYKGLIWPEDDLLASLAGIAGVTYNDSVEETIAIADTTTVKMTRGLSVSESLGVSDITNFTGSIGRKVEESLGLADTTNRSGILSGKVQESVGLVDTANRSGVLAAQVLESIHLAETVNAVAVWALQVAEHLTITDTQNVGVHTPASVVESVGLADASNAGRTILESVVESIGVHDTTDVQRILAARVVETFGLQDTVTPFFELFARVSESVTIRDVTHSYQIFVATLIEEIAIQDILDATITASLLGQLIALQGRWLEEVYLQGVYADQVVLQGRGYPMDHQRAPEQAFEMTAGDTKRLILSISDQGGAPKDLSTATNIEWQMFKYPSGPAVLTKTLGHGVQVVSAAGGVVQVNLFPTDTTSVVPDKYYHIVVVTYVPDDVQTVFRDWITLLPKVIPIPP